MIHILRLGPDLTDGDVECATLAVITQFYGRAESPAEAGVRARLADLVGPGLLADLLRGDRPLWVTSNAIDGWRIEPAD